MTEQARKLENGYLMVPIDAAKKAGKFFPLYIRLLKAKPGFYPSTKGIATMTGLDPQSVRRGCKSLERDGLFKKVGAYGWAAIPLDTKGGYALLDRELKETYLWSGALTHFEARVLTVLQRFWNFNINPSQFRLKKLTGINTAQLQNALVGLASLNILDVDTIQPLPRDQWLKPSTKEQANAV